MVLWPRIFKTLFYVKVTTPSLEGGQNPYFDEIRGIGCFLVNWSQRSSFWGFSRFHIVLYKFIRSRTRSRKPHLKIRPASLFLRVWHFEEKFRKKKNPNWVWAYFGKEIPHFGFEEFGMSVKKKHISRGISNRCFRYIELLSVHLRITL